MPDTDAPNTETVAPPLPNASIDFNALQEAAAAGPEALAAALAPTGAAVLVPEASETARAEAEAAAVATAAAADAAAAAEPAPSEEPIADAPAAKPGRARAAPAPDTAAGD